MPRAETTLFAAAVLPALALLWCFPYFPSQDGPTHLENAVILRDYGRADRPALRDFYTLNSRFDPNWFGHLALRGLLAFLPPLAAEKVFLSGYLVLLPWAAWYALEGRRPGNGPLAVLVLPFVPNFLYHMGFHNFCYGLAGYFLVVGYWLRHEARFGARQALSLAALVVLLYFCHLVAVVLALMTVGTLGLAWAGADRGRGAVRRLGWTLLAFAPALALGAAFVGRQGAASASEFTAGQLWERLRGLEVLVSYLNLERLVAGAVFWGLVGLSGLVLMTRLRRRRLERNDAFLLVVALTVLAYFLAPSALAGGSFVNTRLSLFPFFALVLWLGAQPFGGAVRKILLAAASVVTLALVLLHGLAYARFNDYLREYMSAEAFLRPNATLLPLTFGRQLRGDDLVASAKVGVFRHAAGYLAARAGVVELENYEATTGYFPVLFRDELNPFVHLSPEGRGTDVGLQAEPPSVDIAAYERRTGRTVDFVLLWNVRPERRDDPAGHDVFRQLDAGYEHVHTSAPRGLLQLYRRKPR